MNKLCCAPLDYWCCNGMQLRAHFVTPCTWGLKWCVGARMKVLVQIQKQINLHKPKKLVNMNWSQFVLWLNHGEPKKHFICIT